MRPKLTWRYRSWSDGSWVEPVSESFRQSYGDAAAQTVEYVRDRLREHRAEPTSQDIKATLRAIAEAPADADLTRLDTNTDARMLKHAWVTYRSQSVEALQLDQVAACARAALADLSCTNGRPKSNELALELVRNLLVQLPRATPPAKRDEVLRSALQECGLGTSTRTIKALRSLVGKSRIQLVRNVPPPASPWNVMLQSLQSPSKKARKTRPPRAG